MKEDALDQARPIVFVVDDEPAICLSLKRLVRSVGLEAETFTSAREFLRYKRPDGPACLVLDVRLPDLSGLDLQQELLDAKVDLPVIFITGLRHSHVGSRHEGRRRRISYQAVSRSRSGGCHTARDRKTQSSTATARRARPTACAPRLA